PLCCHDGSRPHRSRSFPARPSTAASRNCGTTCVARESTSPMAGMKILSDWLTQRVENAPIAKHRDLPPMAAMRIRMEWQKLKRDAAEGDELWAFENPSNTWKKLGHH